jgi:hypothetical protein
MDNTIIVMLISASVGVIAMCMKLTYSSKCKRIKCGCITIERDTDHEQNINLGSTPQQNSMV